MNYHRWTLLERAAIWIIEALSNWLDRRASRPGYWDDEAPTSITEWTGRWD